jgi:hypothetical protein
MKTYGEVEIWLHTFLTSTIDGGEWSALRPGRFSFGENPCTHYMGGWKGHIAGLDVDLMHSTKVNNMGLLVTA